MLGRPRFKECFQIEVIEPDKVFLLSERHNFLLTGEIFPHLVRAIDGQHTSDEIAELLQNRFSAVAVYYALLSLAKNGYIVETRVARSQPLAEGEESLEPTSAPERFHARRVDIEVCGDLQSAIAGADAVTAIQTTLEASGIPVDTTGNFSIVLTDDYLREELDDRNQQALQEGRPWLLAKPVGWTLWLGPIFQPGKTGCWQCLVQRLRGNRPVESFVEQHLGRAIRAPATATPASLQAAWGLVASAACQWLAGEPEPPLLGRLVTFDTRAIATQSHVLVKQPQCPACGDPSGAGERLLQPLALSSCIKKFAADGGHRCLTPAEVLERHKHHLSPLLGAVRGLQKVRGFDSSAPIHSYVASHYGAISGKSTESLRVDLAGRSGGKGKTDVQARASGFCEAIERYSGHFQGYEALKQASYDALGDLAIHPNACLLFSKAQYAGRQEWNLTCQTRQRVPAPFDPEQAIAWTPVWSFKAQTHKYLPTAYCYYGYPQRSAPFCYPDSNGCAAGSTLEEALLQGLMELIERDGVAMWWYNRLQRPAVDLDSFQVSYFGTLQKTYEQMQRQLWVLDLTNDLQIPIFVAISRRCDRPEEEILCGFGAHLDPKIAIARALTEVNQALPLFAANSHQFVPREWSQVLVGQHPYLCPAPQGLPKTAKDYPQIWSEDLREDVRYCIDLLHGKGLEVLALDQTRPDIELKVVRAIVPGLRHCWKRWAPGRLYDVPVQLGWLPEATPEVSLNPIALFI